MEKYLVAIEPTAEFPDEVEADDHVDAARIVMYDWVHDAVKADDWAQGGTVYVRRKSETEWKVLWVDVDWEPQITARLDEDA